MQAPITQLCHDLLDYILMLTTDQPRHALALSHVCRFWRRVALLQPFLWRIITVVNDLKTCAIIPIFEAHSNDSEDHTGRPVFRHSRYQFLQHCIHYSGSLPLEIKVNLRMSNVLARGAEEYPDSFTLYHSRSQLIGTILTRASSRISSLRVECNCYIAAQWLFNGLQLVGDCWTQLRDCQIEWTAPNAFENMHPQAKTHPVVWMPQVSPSRLALVRSARQPRVSIKPFSELRNLHLRGLSVDWNSLSPSRLEELHIQDMDPEIAPTFEQLRKVLVANSKTLKVLEISNCDPLAETVEWKELFLPNLRILLLGYTDPRQFGAITDMLWVPRVKRLSVTNLNECSGLETEEYFRQTIELFQGLERVCDFTRLEFLELVDVGFMGNEMVPSPSDYMNSIQGVPTGVVLPPGIPLGFFARCLALEVLVLVRPDDATLWSLNCGRRFGEDLDGNNTWRFPTPKLRHLKIDGSKAEVVEGFLTERSDVRKNWLFTEGYKRLHLVLEDLDKLVKFQPFKSVIQSIHQKTMFD